MTMHNKASDAPEGVNHLYQQLGQTNLAEVFRREFRMFYNEDGTLNAGLAFENIDYRLCDLSEIIAIARDQLLEVPKSTTVGEIGSLLNSSIALLCTIIPPFEALQVRVAELERLTRSAQSSAPGKP